MTAPVFQEDYVGAADHCPGTPSTHPSPAPPGLIPDPGVVTDYTGNALVREHHTTRLASTTTSPRASWPTSCYSRGFKSGGFDMRGNALLNPSTENGYNSETANNYELGIKTTLLR